MLIIRAATERWQMRSMPQEDQFSTHCATGVKTIPGIGAALLRTAGESRETSSNTGIRTIPGVPARVEMLGTVEAYLDFTVRS